MEIRYLKFARIEDDYLDSVTIKNGHPHLVGVVFAEVNRADDEALLCLSVVDNDRLLVGNIFEANVLPGSLVVGRLNVNNVLAVESKEGEGHLIAAGLRFLIVCLSIVPVFDVGSGERT